ncbi:MAG TPA: S8 family serine peptidase [Streptosporangiaceae bacterium]|nr:S8 family serine peptidase [Streptosporangiaceae bacterium]
MTHRMWTFARNTRGPARTGGWGRRSIIRAATTVTLATAVSGALAVPLAQASTHQSGGRPVAAHRAGTPASSQAFAVPAGMKTACPAAPAGEARCFTFYRPQTSVNRAIAAGVHGKAAQPTGWSPQQIRAAYKLPASTGSNQTVAITIAFDTPKLAQYLAVYRQHYGLPPCTTASGCLRIVNQKGQPSPLPVSGVHSGWDLEATLDVSMVSVACPFCHILVVEANTNSLGDLATAEDSAAKLGAQVISNSYGGREDGFALAFASAYDHPGHTIVASSGDSGYDAANFPADLSTVTAAGGTALSHSARGWTEIVWKYGSSGCSAYVPKPAWQHDNHCPGRTIADVSAVAINVPIYNADYHGWVTVGGTSISAPLISGIYGLAGNGASLAPGSVYQHASSLFDITRGNNAAFGTPAQVCGGDYLCVAKKGYDAPTGLGTPDGTGAF